MTCTLALGLAGTLILGPWMVTGEEGDHPLWVLLAEDLTVRRTVLASSLGLLVTACVFFKPPRFLFGKTKKTTPPLGPPSNFAGA